MYIYIYVYEEVRHDIHNSGNSNIASSTSLFGVMIWENHIRDLWEYFKLWEMTLNRAFMG